MSFKEYLDNRMILENEIYSNSAEKADFLKNKTNLGNAFWINMLGFTALKQLATTDARLKTYFKKDPVRLKKITDGNSDFTLVVKLASDENFITTAVANEITRFMVLIKTNKITKIDETKWRVILNKVKLSVLKPNAQIKKIVQEFLDGIRTLEKCLPPMYLYAKRLKKDNVANEFFNMVHLLKSTIKIDLGDDDSTSPTPMTMPDGSQTPTQTITDDDGDAKISVMTIITSAEMIGRKWRARNGVVYANRAACARALLWGWGLTPKEAIDVSGIEAFRINNIYRIDSKNPANQNVDRDTGLLKGKLAKAPAQVQARSNAPKPKPAIGVDWSQFTLESAPLVNENEQYFMIHYYWNMDIKSIRKDLRRLGLTTMKDQKAIFSTGKEVLRIAEQKITADPSSAVYQKYKDFMKLIDTSQALKITQYQIENFAKAFGLDDMTRRWVDQEFNFYDLEWWKKFHQGYKFTQIFKQKPKVKRGFSLSNQILQSFKNTFEKDFMKAVKYLYNLNDSDVGAVVGGSGWKNRIINFLIREVDRPTTTITFIKLLASLSNENLKELYKLKFWDDRTNLLIYYRYSDENIKTYKKALRKRLRDSGILFKITNLTDDDIEDMTEISDEILSIIVVKIEQRRLFSDSWNNLLKDSGGFEEALIKAGMYDDILEKFKGNKNSIFCLMNTGFYSKGNDSMLILDILKNPVDGVYQSVAAIDGTFSYGYDKDKFGILFTNNFYQQAFVEYFYHFHDKYVDSDVFFWVYSKLKPYLNEGQKRTVDELALSKKWGNWNFKYFNKNVGKFISTVSVDLIEKNYPVWVKEGYYVENCVYDYIKINGSFILTDKKLIDDFVKRFGKKLPENILSLRKFTPQYAYDKIVDVIIETAARTSESPFADINLQTASPELVVKIRTQIDKFKKKWLDEGNIGPLVCTNWGKSYFTDDEKIDLFIAYQRGFVCEEITKYSQTYYMDETFDFMSTVEGKIKFLFKNKSLLKNERRINKIVKGLNLAGLVDDILKDQTMTEDQKETQLKRMVEVISTGPTGNNRKGHVLNNLANEMMVIPAMKQMLKDKSTPIRPLKKLSPKELLDVLRFNNFTIDKKQIPKHRSGNYSDYFRQLENGTDKISIPDLQIDKIEETVEDLGRKSVEYSFKYGNNRHGHYGIKFLESFNVSLRPKELINFIAANPNPTIIPAFHGTGSVAASMILRFGFKIVTKSIAGVETVGKMLGDGVYFSNVISKAAIYLGDSGGYKGEGEVGYIFEMEAYIGKEYVNYKAAGLGNDSIRSPEWCVYDPRAQLKITKAHKVVKVNFEEIKDLKTKYPDAVTEDRYFPPVSKNFREYLIEQEKRMANSMVYIFMDGEIPVGVNKVLDFEKFKSKYESDNLWVDYGQEGPVVIVKNNNLQQNGVVKVNNSTRWSITDDLNGQGGLFSQWLTLIKKST